jgi:sugar lactone lactonase YvrE
MEGIVLGESPRWHDGRLWCCDWGARQLLAIDLDGHREVVPTAPSVPWSIDWLPDGRLLFTAAGERALVAQAADGSQQRYADLAHLSSYGWNELVVDGRGNAYINNIDYDMMGGESPRPGIIAVVTPDGAARLVADEVEFPNGMVVTADDSTLIVAESHGRRLTAFDIGTDGGLSNRRVWADLGDGAPDGICLDADGAVWYADVPNRRSVRVREGGEVLETVTVDRGCFACMLGGEAGDTLFVVAADWRGTASMDQGRTGIVVTATAPAPHAGRP